MNDDKIKHLEFIEATISRFNSNSFVIKGWAITIFCALLALFANGGNVPYLWISFCPTLLFWALDGFYLMKEKEYRRLYDEVANITTMASVKPFDMCTDKYKSKHGYVKALFSKTIDSFYLTMGIINFIIIIFNIF